MGSYNILKEIVAQQTKSDGSSTKATNPLITFGTGAAAGTITVYVTQPFDTVKTRTQGAQGQPLGAAVTSIWKDSGAIGFWRGSTMRLGRLVVSGGLVFTIYEHVSALLMSMSVGKRAIVVS